MPHLCELTMAAFIFKSIDDSVLPVLSQVAGFLVPLSWSLTNIAQRHIEMMADTPTKHLPRSRTLSVMLQGYGQVPDCRCQGVGK